jgi:hypothetical protein
MAGIGVVLSWYCRVRRMVGLVRTAECGRLERWSKMLVSSGRRRELAVSASGVCARMGVGCSAMLLALA